MKTSTLTWVLLACACGTPSTKPETPAAPSAAPEPPPTAAPEPAASASAPEAQASADAAAPESPTTAPEGGPREVKYVMAGGKLEVELDGVKFKPSAKAVKVGGGWGIAIEVEGDSQDDKMHSLLKPKSGPLAIAAKVTRKGGKVEEQTDTREGEDEDFVTPGTLAKLERKWPTGPKDKPLSAGDKVQLMVGLWGIGPDSKSRRPLKKFFSVTMVVGKGEPRPLIAPPE